MQQTKQAKYCFNLRNNAKIMCFNKFTGEHNGNKIFLKNFVLWEYIFKCDILSLGIKFTHIFICSYIQAYLHTISCYRHLNVFQLIFSNQLECVMKLLEWGVHCDLGTEKLKQSPTHIAAFAGHSRCLKWLLNCGANMNCQVKMQK